MKPNKFAAILILSSILLTGCQLQIRFTFLDSSVPTSVTSSSTEPVLESSSEETHSELGPLGPTSYATLSESAEEYVPASEMPMPDFDSSEISDLESISSEDIESSPAEESSTSSQIDSASEESSFISSKEESSSAQESSSEESSVRSSQESSSAESSTPESSSEASSSKPSSSSEVSSEKESSSSKQESSSQESSSEPEITYETMILDSSDAITGGYSTGNYGFTTINSTSFEYYRTGSNSSSNYLVTLLTGSDYTPYPGIGGSLANTSAIYDICKITLTYSSSSSGKLYYGQTQVYDGSMTIPAANTTSTFTLPSNVTTNYFMIESGDSDMDISSITLYYTGHSSSSTTTFLSSGQGLYRLNPSVYSGTLVSGTSKVTMPTNITVTGNTYTVTSSKTYTYYSLDDIVADNSLASKASYTSPIDVINYFVAFKTWPCNYYYKTSNLSSYFSITSSQAKNIFGDDFRYVSFYSKTGGYVNYVPYSTGTGTKPDYYECDIDLDGTYNMGSNRGVGRVIVFTKGYSTSKGATDYDSSPVGVYTDDHYTTFQEYYNNGTFSHRYNAIYSSTHSNRTCYEYGAPTTLN